MLLQNNSFEKLRDEGFRKDPKSRQFAAQYRREAQAGKPEDLTGKRLGAWRAGQKIRDWVVDFFAPFSIGEYAPASLGATAAVRATNAEFLPDIGGYLRIEVEPKEGTDLLNVRIWLEDNEGARPFERVLAAGILEARNGALVREVEAESDERSLINIEVDPEVEQRLIFSLQEGGRVLVEDFEVAFTK